ncbi:hypothetical protein DFH07DRAFT_468039 [Mycena maculata]|uniref:Uncharacterized protein n=1 Tax=Mycena maculata TaxID=230809 RepID=A0AAD7K834_9AGAR|nr:hypothetical protein DFH07DRAFT_468039 [Mycena maculata]
MLVAIIKQCPLLVHLYFEPLLGTQESIHIPALKSLAISIRDAADTPRVEEICSLLDTPALTDLTIYHDQTCVLFNSSHVSFPASTSLKIVGDCCTAEEGGIMTTLQKISSPPLQLFPALSSLTMANQCFTANILSDLLGRIHHRGHFCRLSHSVLRRQTWTKYTVLCSAWCAQKKRFLNSGFQQRCIPKNGGTRTGWMRSCSIPLTSQPLSIDARFSSCYLAISTTWALFSASGTSLGRPSISITAK